MSDKYLIDVWKVPIFAVDQAKLDDWCCNQPPIQTYFRGQRNPIGIEIEAEGVNQGSWAVGLQHNPFWTMTEDGSLKNKGHEFISKPISGIGIDYAIDSFARLEKLHPVLNSIRTSIHVHVNMSQYKLSQLKALVATYGLVENLFFNFVSPLRKANNYCYPLTQTSPSESCHVVPITKYAAMNLAPIETQMTVEFRALEGTKDWTKVRRWIQLVTKLVRFCQEHPAQEIENKIFNLPRDGDFEGFLKRIFGATIAVFNSQSIIKDCRENLLWSQMVLKA